METTINKILGWGIIIYGLTFLWYTTDHFGNNLFPESKEEWITDITGALIVFCGIKIKNK